MKFNLNKPVTDFNGKEIPNTNLGKDLARVIAFSTGGDAKTLIYIGQKLYDGQEFELDPTTHKSLVDFVNKSDKIINLAKAQMLNILEEK